MKHNPAGTDSVDDEGGPTDDAERGTRHRPWAIIPEKKSTQYKKYGRLTSRRFAPNAAIRSRYTGNEDRWREACASSISAGTRRFVAGARRIRSLWANGRLYVLGSFWDWAGRVV